MLLTLHSSYMDTHTPVVILVPLPGSVGGVGVVTFGCC